MKHTIFFNFIAGLWQEIAARFEKQTEMKVKAIATGPRPKASVPFRKGEADLLVWWKMIRTGEDLSGRNFSPDGVITCYFFLLNRLFYKILTKTDLCG